MTQRPPIGPQDKIRSIEPLLTCLRASPERSERFRQLTEADWQDVLGAARHYALLPLLYDAVKNRDVPPHVLAVAHKAYLHTAARNLRLYRRLAELLAVFEAHGHTVLLLKGAHLAEFVYGNPALRPMADLDLLARPQEVPSLLALLADCGYVAVESAWGASLRHEVPYRGPDGTLVEIHNRLFETRLGSDEETEAVWTRACSVSLQGAAARVLCPEDLLMHLSVHAGVQHGFDNGLLPFMDVRRAVERYGAVLDWKALREQSDRWGATRCVGLMLTLANQRFGLRIPEYAAALFASCPDAMAQADSLIRQTASQSVGVTQDLARLFYTPGWRPKISRLRERLIPENGPHRPPHGDKGTITRRLVRARELIGKYGWTMLAGVLGNKEIRAALEIEHTRNKLKDWLAQQPDPS